MVERYRRADAPDQGPVAESWEISDRGDGMSVVADGPWAGHTLRSLMQDHGEALVGKAHAGGVFPLLIKLIDARETLSVQVHPDDEDARQGRGDAKSEAWYMIDAMPGSCVFRGFVPELKRDLAEASLTDGTIGDLLQRVPVAAGDIVYVPGGTVHAIGRGCQLLEVQQNSNTTFRIFDWHRVGADGKARELHLKQAREVIHWESDQTHSPADEGRCVTPFFSIEPRELGKRALSVADPLKSFTVIFVEEGEIVFQCKQGEFGAVAGSTWLLPAALRPVKVARVSGAPARVVIIRGRPGG